LTRKELIELGGFFELFREDPI